MREQMSQQVPLETDFSVYYQAILDWSLFLKYVTANSVLTPSSTSRIYNKILLESYN